VNVPPVAVLLIGMMGCGKSTVGRSLAAATGWTYVDNDALLQDLTGLDTAALLARKGESALRDAESQVLREILHLDRPYIAGVAAGVVARPADRALLVGSDAVVVWLRARIETLVRNVGDGAGRPWLQPDPEDALRRLATGRAALYAEVADVVIDVEDGSPDELAAGILTQLQT
jgi:shikimate kinase